MKINLRKIELQILSNYGQTEEDRAALLKCFSFIRKAYSEGRNERILTTELFRMCRGDDDVSCTIALAVGELNAAGVLSSDVVLKFEGENHHFSDIFSIPSDIAKKADVKDLTIYSIVLGGENEIEERNFFSKVLNF